MTYPSGWPAALPRPSNLRFPRQQSQSDWFEIYALNPRTFAILEPLHDEETISYLLLGDDRAVLLDTGMGIGDIAAEVCRLTSLPVTVINSHHHYDHVGDNSRFTEVWCANSAFGVKALAQGRSPASLAHVLSPGRWLRLPPGFDPASYAISPCHVTRRLEHGEEIDLGGRVLQVHRTPGHSDSDLCLFDRQFGLLFTGDTYYPGSMFASDEDADFPVYLRSLQYLCGLLDQVSALCPAHNEASLPPDRLPVVLAAFESAADARAPFTRGENGERLYAFDGFRLILSEAALRGRQVG